MWTVIIIIVIVVFIGMKHFLEDFYYELEDFVMGGVFTLLYALLGGIIGFVVALTLPADLEIQETSYELEALQDNGGVEGSFFLGCGTIDSKMMYVFYYKDGVTKRGDTIYRMGQVDYDEAEVVYINSLSESPYLLEYKEVESDAFINNFAIDVTKTWYRIYVPKGTINNGYTLDAK